MAQYKYDLITVPTEPKGPRRHHPWYKERLKLKFLKSNSHSGQLDGSKWTFVAGDIDDFRTGAPMKTKGRDMLKKKNINPVPLINTRSSEVLRKSSSNFHSVSWRSKIISNNPGLRTLYSKVGPQRQAQQEHMYEAEASLLRHPFSLYPHLEESIDPELREDVVLLLDPELKQEFSECELHLGSEQSVNQNDNVIKEEDEGEEGEGSPSKEPIDHVASEEQVLSQESSRRQLAVYKFPLKKTREEREREKSIIDSQRVISASQQSKVDQVTHNLVQWVRDLGGSDDASTIDDQTIKNLFGSDYESKPMLIAPVHVVELVNIPPELRLESRGYSHSAFSGSPSLRPDSAYSYVGYENQARKRARGFTVPWMSIEEPRCVKTKYGAWYLPISMWKLRPADEPLQDPKDVQAKAESDDVMKGLAMDKMFASLHGARVFKDFIINTKRAALMPKFLKNVSASGSGRCQSQSATKRWTPSSS